MSIRRQATNIPSAAATATAPTMASVARSPISDASTIQPARITDPIPQPSKTTIIDRAKNSGREWINTAIETISEAPPIARLAR